MPIFFLADGVNDLTGVWLNSARAEKSPRRRVFVFRVMTNEFSFSRHHSLIVYDRENENLLVNTWNTNAAFDTIVIRYVRKTCARVADFGKWVINYSLPEVLNRKFTDRLFVCCNFKTFHLT